MDKLDKILAKMYLSPESEDFIKSYVQQNPGSEQLVEDIIQLDQGITEMDLIKTLKKSQSIEK